LYYFILNEGPFHYTTKTAPQSICLLLNLSLTTQRTSW